jgi:hypothetical protein
VTAGGDPARIDMRSIALDSRWPWSVWRAVDEAIICLVADLAADRARVPPVLPVPVAVARAEEVVEAAAEAIWASPCENPLDDRTLAERLVGGVSLSEAEAEALLRVAEIRVRAMVDDASFWAAVLAVAALLNRHGHLDATPCGSRPNGPCGDCAGRPTTRTKRTQVARKQPDPGDPEKVYINIGAYAMDHPDLPPMATYPQRTRLRGSHPAVMLAFQNWIEDGAGDDEIRAAQVALGAPVT